MVSNSVSQRCFQARLIIALLAAVSASSSLSVFAQSPLAQDPAVTTEQVKVVTDAAALQSLVTRLEKIHSVTGVFVQHSLDQKGVRSQQSKGEFKAQRPGKFYWHTDAPLEQTVYSDGVTVTVYDPDLEQATVQPASKEIENTPAILFSGDMATIGRTFRVEERRWGDEAELAVVQYVLFPLASDSLYSQLRVRFENEILNEMRLLDSLGQQNTISFDDVVLNPYLPESVFIPTFPENTDIIREVPVEPGQNLRPDAP